MKIYTIPAHWVKTKNWTEKLEQELFKLTYTQYVCKSDYAKLRDNLSGRVGDTDEQLTKFLGLKKEILENDNKIIKIRGLIFDAPPETYIDLLEIHRLMKQKYKNLYFAFGINVECYGLDTTECNKILLKEIISMDKTIKGLEKLIKIEEEKRT